MAKTKVHGEYLDPSVISGQTQVTAVGADSVLIFDATDNALKKALLSDVIETVGSTPTFSQISSTGDLTIDAAGDIILDADGADIKFRDGGAGFFTISNSSLDAVLKVDQSNEDLIIKGNDGGSEITALTLDMSEAGKATFNDAVVADSFETTAGGTFTTASGNDLNIVYPDTRSLFIKEGSTTHVAVDNTGQVGIGTASPSAPLHIVGDGNTGQRVHVGTSSAHQIYLGNTGGVSSVGTLTDHDFQLIRNGSAKLTTSSTGISITGVTACSDKITHGNGELDLYDGSSNTVLKNGITNGNVKLQTIVSGVGAANTLIAGDGALGQVDTPYQSSFHAYSPAVTNGGGNIIIFGNTYHNTGSDYDTSNGRYTAPRGGRYLFTASLLMDPGSNSSYERILFATNANAGSTTYGDTLTIPGTTGDNGIKAYDSLNISVILYLGANDYVTVQNAGESPTYGTSYGAFTGYYLG